MGGKTELRVSELILEDGQLRKRLICFGGQHFIVKETPNRPKLDHVQVEIIEQGSCDEVSCRFLPVIPLSQLGRAVESGECHNQWYGDRRLLQTIGLFAPLDEPIYRKCSTKQNFGFGAYEGMVLHKHDAGELFFVGWAELGYRVPAAGEIITISGTMWSEGATGDSSSPSIERYIRRGRKIVKTR